MRPQRVIPVKDLKEIEKRMNSAKSLREFRYAQVLYLRGEYQKEAQEIAKTTSYAIDTVKSILKRYFKIGLALFKDINEPRQRKWGNLGLEEEKIFVQGFVEQAHLGGIIEVGRIKKDYEKRIGHATSKSVIYNLLHRHDWRKIVPRPSHPKKGLEQVASFKKTLLN